MNQKDIGGGGGRGDGSKILDRVVGSFRVEAGIDDVARADNHDGVAVGSRVRSCPHAKISTSARLVFDVKMLTETAREIACDNPGENVGWAPWRKRHNHAHGPLGIGLRLCNPRKRYSGGACSQK